MNTRLTLCIVLLLVSKIGFGQGEDFAKYWVTLTNKAQTPFSVSEPEAYLSPRAIERREKQGIAITKQDLPVSSIYLNEIKKIGATIHNTSRWFNATTIVATAQQVERIKEFEFVKEVKYVGKHLQQTPLMGAHLKEHPSFEYTKKTRGKYGHAQRQIQLVNGTHLHQKAFRGEGIMIAVMDGGFAGTKESTVLENTTIIATKDFVDNDDFVYESSTHGTEVLSVMAANLEGMMIGTAPNANYILIKTEDVRGEYIMEECNWIAGLEYADSMGVDLINSSLGYATFSDASMNYSYENMDGYTSLSSRAADIAFSKGMIVVCSAGNSGDEEWKYINAPADAFDVISVGATDPYANKAFFSSFGPTADGRIKPELVAMGQEICVASVFTDKVYPSNGTSFAAPVITGMIACLWQAFPDETNVTIKEMVLRNSKDAKKPNCRVGHGMPDFYKTYLENTLLNCILKDEPINLLLFPWLEKTN